MLASGDNRKGEDPTCFRNQSKFHLPIESDISGSFYHTVFTTAALASLGAIVMLASLSFK